MLNMVAERMRKAQGGIRCPEPLRIKEEAWKMKHLRVFTILLCLTLSITILSACGDKEPTQIPTHRLLLAAVRV